MRTLRSSRQSLLGDGERPTVAIGFGAPEPRRRRGGSRPAKPPEVQPGRALAPRQRRGGPPAPIPVQDHSWLAHEDLIQDVLIDLIRAWRSHSIREPERFAGFVRTLACRRLADAFSREHRACALDRQQGPAFDAATIATVGLGPSELKLDARRALAKLDRAALRALKAVYGEGWTYEEAASVLGVPLGTLKRRLTGAMRLLREDLAGSEVDLAADSAAPDHERLAS